MVFFCFVGPASGTELANLPGVAADIGEVAAIARTELPSTVWVLPARNLDEAFHLSAVVLEHFYGDAFVTETVGSASRPPRICLKTRRFDKSE